MTFQFRGRALRHDRGQDCSSLGSTLEKISYMRIPASNLAFFFELHLDKPNRVFNQRLTTQRITVADIDLSPFYPLRSDLVVVNRFLEVGGKRFLFLPVDLFLAESCSRSFAVP